MRNVTTDHKWQVLYNFAALPGQGWQNVLITSTFPSADTVTFSYTVTAKVTVNIAGKPHVQLSVDRKSSYLPSNITSHTITERFGSHDFLFLAYSRETSDGDEFAQRLCYKDDTVGLHTFSSFPCSYETVGLPKNAGEIVHHIFPNPASDKVCIETISGGENRLMLVDLWGQVFASMRLTRTPACIDLHSIPAGMYTILFFRKEALVSSEKLIICEQ